MVFVKSSEYIYIVFGKYLNLDTLVFARIYQDIFSWWFRIMEKTIKVTMVVLMLS